MQRKLMIPWLLLTAICSPVISADWEASIEKEMKALVASCVVVPCSFRHPRVKQASSNLRGIWHLLSNRKQLVYHEENSMIMEKFRDRTKLLGRLGEGNCSLQINEVKEHDNGPFCFRIELANNETNQFSFIDDCIQLDMLFDPPKPVLQHSKTASQGLPFTITCSVTHTCPAHAPTLTWKKGPNEGMTEAFEDHKEIHTGYWLFKSTLTFIPEEKDDHTEITCTAKFNGGGSSSATLPLFIKRKQSYNHIIVPAAVGVGTAVIFGALCIFMMKKHKRHIAELRNRDGGVWNRLSRLSRRIHSGTSGPIHSDQRNLRSTSFGEQKASKPRFPSPKCQPKYNSHKENPDDDDDYVNTADLNIYGNL